MWLFSADTLLQPLAIHKVWLHACAASRRKITRRMWFFSADTLLQPLAIHKVWLHVCAASRRKITRRMWFFSADTLLQPLAIHKVWLHVCAASRRKITRRMWLFSADTLLQSLAIHKVWLHACAPCAFIPSPPPAAWRCVRGGCVPIPLRRIRWASGSPASASASCRIRTPGTPAGRCSRWPAPARSS